MVEPVTKPRRLRKTRLLKTKLRKVRQQIPPHERRMLQQSFPIKPPQKSCR